MTGLQLFLIGLIAMLAGAGSVLDSFQTHRPLICCTLVGLVLGDLRTGVIIGGTLEVISIGWMNIGAAVGPDSALASIISAIIVIVGGQSINSGVALAIPVAIAGQVLAIFSKTVAVFFQHWGDKAAKTGDFRTINVAHMSAISLHMLRVFIPVMLVALSLNTTAAQEFFNNIPDVITGGLNVSGGILMVVGYAMVINMIHSKVLMPFFFMGFVLSGFIYMNLVGFGILGVCIAIIYIQINPSLQKQVAAVSARTMTTNNFDDELD